MSRTFCLLALVLWAAFGCGRQYYRLQADREVSELIAEKSCDPRWGLPGFSIEMDPRSRYYDAYDPDKPPIPSDDPASHALMHFVDGKKGWHKWHKNGDRPGLENEEWKASLGEYVRYDDQGCIILDLDTALRLFRIHSPNYQRQLEELYLTALDVSTERFVLDTQFFFGNVTRFSHQGHNGRGGELSVLDTNNLGTGNGNASGGGAASRIQAHSVNAPGINPLTVPGVSSAGNVARRQFATAGELLVGFANSFVWSFSGDNRDAAISLANFSLVQPLLRGAGRDVALERLTRSERILLANMRSFQRYRQGTFTLVAIGEGVGGSQRSGGLLGDTGLSGFTGQGAGGQSGVGDATGIGRQGTDGGNTTGGTGAAATGLAGGGAGRVGGFYELLQRMQEIPNNEASIKAQQYTEQFLVDHFGGQLENTAELTTQLFELRQSIFTEQANLLLQRRDLRNSIEQFVTNTLGLPPDVCVKLDDSPLAGLKLLTPESVELQNATLRLQVELGKLGQNGVNPSKLLDLWPEVEKLNDEVKEVVSSTRRDLQELVKRLETEMPEFAQFEENHNRIRALLTELPAIKSSLDDAATAMDIAAAEGIRTRLIDWIRSLLPLIDELALTPVGPRLQGIRVEPISLASEEAFRIALTMRLDLMNSRAALVDQWRLIAFNADALQGSVNVSLRGDVTTSPNNIVKFQGANSRLQAGLEFDTPLTRLKERNNYRQSLIDYQRERRRLIQTEDGIHRDLRRMLRELNVQRENLELQRLAVRLALDRAVVTYMNQQKPGRVLGPNDVRNRLGALSDLRNTQNNIMSVWLRYQAVRMQLYRDLGLMQLDDNGRWIELPLPTTDEIEEEEVPIPPAVPIEWFELAADDGPHVKDNGKKATRKFDDRVVPASHQAEAKSPTQGVQRR